MATSGYADTLVDNVFSQASLFGRGKHDVIMLHNGNVPLNSVPTVDTLAVHQASLHNARSLHAVYTFSQTEQSTELTQWLVSLKAPVTEQAKAAVNTHIAPWKLGSYVPHNTFFVVALATTEAKQRLSSAPGVQAVTAYEPAAKVPSYLLTKSEGMAVMSDAPTTLHIHVALGIHRSLDELRAVAARWQDQLRSEGVDTTVNVLNERVVRAVVSDASRAAAWLATRNEVHWVEKATRFEVQNKWAKHTIQGNHLNVTELYDHGLLGQGQVFVVGDTGIDYDHCFFDDPSSPMPINEPSSTHRKFVQYVALRDAEDIAYGHGSHVAASIAGDVVVDSTAGQQLRDYNGMAPKSKLVFYDFQQTTEPDLDVPSDLYTEYFEPAMKKGGAMISSNSWGDKEGYYDMYAMATDRMVYDYPNFLPVFAAGNYGERGYKSISSPGVSKNVLTVGACKSASDSWAEQGQAFGVHVSEPSDDEYGLVGNYQVLPATDGFGPAFSKAKLELNTPLVFAVPNDGCAAPTNAAAIKGKVAMVRRTSCPFTTKVLNMQQAGAIMVLVSNDLDGPLVAMGPDGTGRERSITIPSGMTTKAFGDSVLTVTKAGQTVLIDGPVDFRAEDLNEDNLPSFSSRGPTLDGRLKPDILAPGQFITSLRSDGNPRSHQCNGMGDLMNLQGTSMAAPIAAGGIGLVRQYFMEGFYPGGKRDPANGFTPSAALLKAMAVSSTLSVHGIVQTLTSYGYINNNVLAAPSIYQGFGRMQLTMSMPFADTPNYPNLFVRDKEQAQTGSLHHYCFRVPAFKDHTPPKTMGRPAFRATLVWTDPPGVPSAGPALVNNLDLFVVRIDTREVFLGNGQHFHDANGDHYAWDDLNNVEQVTIQNTLATALYSVHVRGNNVPQGPQAFSLVVNGVFEQLNVTDCAGPMICPNDCGTAQVRGTCGKDGMCRCPLDRAGSDCNQPVQPMGKASGWVTNWDKYFATSGAVQPNAWTYFSFDSKDDWKADGITITMKRTSLVGDPDMYIAFNRVPTLYWGREGPTHDYNSTNCDDCPQEQRKPNVVKISGAELQVGRYIIGIHGYCCDYAEFTITVDKRTEPGTPSHWPVGITVLLTLLVLLILGGGGCFIMWRRNRAAQAAASGAGPGYRVNNSRGPPFIALSDMAAARVQPGRHVRPTPGANEPSSGAPASSSAAAGHSLPSPQRGTHMPLSQEEQV